MQINVSFYSYFKELAGCAETSLPVEDAATLQDILNAVVARYPRMRGIEKSALIAVGVDYQPRSYRLKEGDKVSLFPPVQGG